MEAVLDAYKNFEYLGLTSYPTDPNYLSANKLYQNLSTSYIRSVPAINFTLFNTYTIVDNNVVTRFGDIPCHAPGKEAFVDSEFTCAIFQFPFFLERIQFGYIVSAFIIPILLISIFGGIKENYRWYFLNQAFWDLFGCYDFICERPTLSAWTYREFVNQQTCFFNVYTTSDVPYWMGFLWAFQEFSRYALFIPILLLAFSRFLGLYFPLFYKRVFSKTYATIIFIVLFNLISIIFISARRVSDVILKNVVKNDRFLCELEFCPSHNLTICRTQKDYFNCANRANANYRYWKSVGKNIPDFIPPIMFLFSTLFVFLLFFKIFFQLRYQMKHNRNVFLGTVKIACVIAFQCFTTSIIFILTTIQQILQIYATGAIEIQIYNFWIYKTLPPWFFFLQYYPTTTSLNLVRILLDSLIVLTLLSGYSSCVIGTCKFLIFCILHPKNAVKFIKSKFGKSNSMLFVLSSPKASHKP